MSTTSPITAQLLRENDGTPLIVENEGSKYVFSAEDQTLYVPVDSVDVTKRYEFKSFPMDGENMINVFLDMGDQNADTSITSDSVASTSSKVASEEPLPSQGKATPDKHQEDDGVVANIEWTDASIKLLIATYDDKNSLLLQRKIKNKKIMFRAIAVVLNDKGYMFTAEQAANKFKSLERAFKKKVDNNNKSGRGRKDCPYSVELESILGHKRNLVPEVTLGTATVTTRVDAESSGNASTENTASIPEGDAESGNRENIRAREPPAKRRRPQPERDIQLVLREIREDRESRRQIANEQNEIEQMKIELMKKILEKL